MKLEFKFQLNTLTLMGINIAVFVLALIIQSLIGLDNNIFYLLGGFIADKVYYGEVWLLITSAFFHLDILHFLFNIYALYRIGQIILVYYSPKVLLTTYIAGALGGSLLSYLAWLIFGGNIYSLGASGAIFALIGLLAGGTLKKYRYGMGLPFSIWDIMPVIVFSFLIGLVPGSRINNWAHLGGLIAGVIFGLFFNHSLSGISSRTQIALENILYKAAIIILLGSFAALIYNAFRLIFI